jgi:hypothetical protein
VTREERRAGDDRPAGGLASFSRLSVRPAPHSAFHGSERWESGLLFRGTQASAQQVSVAVFLAFGCACPRGPAASEG